MLMLKIVVCMRDTARKLRIAYNSVRLKLGAHTIQVWIVNLLSNLGLDVSSCGNVI